MINIYKQLETIAQNALVKLNITGTVLSFRLVYTKCVPMIRITFRAQTKPSVEFTGYSHIEADEEEKDIYYLYASIDIPIQVK